jgi:Transcriptional regulatory protein, C terminal
MQIILQLNDAEIIASLKHYGRLIGFAVDDVRDASITSIPTYILQHSEKKLLLSDYDGEVIQQFNLPIRLSEIGEYLLKLQRKLNNYECYNLSDSIILDKIAKKLLYLQDNPPKTIELTEKECEMLQYIFNAGAGGAEKDELLSQVWGYNPEVKSRTLETHIYRLRQKISDAGVNSPMIIVENGRYLIKT